jgi:hypothetical protein
MSADARHMFISSGSSPISCQVTSAQAQAGIQGRGSAIDLCSCGGATQQLTPEIP